MSRRQLYHLWDFISRIVSAIPPIAIAMYYFPVWVKNGSRPAISGMLLIVVLIASIPFFKKFKSFFEFISNASMPMLWTILAAINYVLMNISGELFTICCGGILGSALSSLVCIQRNKYADDDSNSK